MIAKLLSKIRNVVTGVQHGAIADDQLPSESGLAVTLGVKTDGLQCIAKFVRIRRPRNSKTSRGIKHRAASRMKDRDCFQHKYRACAQECRLRLGESGARLK